MRLFDERTRISTNHIDCACNSNPVLKTAHDAKQTDQMVAYATSVGHRFHGLYLD
jgi:hypothetical protein